MGNYRYDSDLWALTEEEVADSRPVSQRVLGNNYKIRIGLFYARRNVSLILDFVNNLDIGLIRKGNEYQLAHKASAICYQNANRLPVRSDLPGRRVSATTVYW